MTTVESKKPRKVSRAAKMRKYFTDNPTATASEVAKKFKTSYQIAYLIKRGMAEPKKIKLKASEVEAANKLGVSTVEYAKEKIKLMNKPKRKPKLKRTPPPIPASRDGFTYSWINTSALSEEHKDALAAQLSVPQNDLVNHPAHYKMGGIETIDFIEAKNLNYNLGNVVKYITRADHKGNRKQDLEKAAWYLNREIGKL